MTRTSYHIGFFYEECYKTSIYLLWPVSNKHPVTDSELAHFFKKKFNVEYSGTSEFNGRCTELWQDGIVQGHIISLRKWEVNPLWLSILHHEICHATGQILSRRGVLYSNQPDADNEHFCYLSESLFKRCLDILMKKEKE